MNSLQSFHVTTISGNPHNITIINYWQNVYPIQNLHHIRGKWFEVITGNRAAFHELFEKHIQCDIAKLNADQYTLPHILQQKPASLQNYQNGIKVQCSTMSVLVISNKHTCFGAVLRHTVVCHLAREASTPHREYIDRKKESVIFTPQ